VDTLRVVMVGAGGSGKSALTTRFTTGEWTSGKYDPTIEDSYIKDIEVDGVPYKVDIYDTAGPENYRALVDSYMCNAQGFMIVFSLTKDVSVRYAEGTLKDIVQTRAKYDLPMVPYVLVGNKLDLPEREVHGDRVREKAKQLVELCNYPEGMQHICGTYMETSARTNENVTDAFMNLVRQILRSHELEKENNRKELESNKRNANCALM